MRTSGLVCEEEEEEEEGDEEEEEEEGEEEEETAGVVDPVSESVDGVVAQSGDCFGTELVIVMRYVQRSDCCIFGSACQIKTLYECVPRAYACVRYVWCVLQKTLHSLCTFVWLLYRYWDALNWRFVIEIITHWSVGEVVVRVVIVNQDSVCGPVTSRSVSVVVLSMRARALNFLIFTNFQCLGSS